VQSENDDTAKTSAKKKTVRRVAGYGIEAVGSALGAAAGAAYTYLTADPSGAIAGAGVGAIVAKGFGDVALRMLSQREEVRVGCAGITMAGQIQARLVNGESVRQDDFFTARDDGRSDGDEIFEGVLLACRDVFEEKKLPYTANIFVNAAFQEVDPQIVHFALKVSDRLAYRDLCVAALIGRKHQLTFNTDLLQNESHMSADQVASRVPRSTLQQRKADIIRSVAAIGDNYPGMVAMDNSDENGSYKLTQVGVTIFQLMGLQDIPVDELTLLMDVLNTVDIPA